MVKSTTKWRASTAAELGTSVESVKRGVNAVLFGMRYSKWRMKASIQEHKRSASFAKLEKEILKARVLVTDNEVRKGAASAHWKETKTLSRAIEKIEEEITQNLSIRLADKGWTTTTLIHDELILSHSACFPSRCDEIDALRLETTLALRCFEDSRGWPPGTLTAKICEL